MKSAYDTIMKVRATSSKNEKIAILTAAKDNLELAQFLHACYEPSINFFMRKLEPKLGTDPGFKVHVQPGQLGLSLLNEFISRIAGRELTGHNAKRWVNAVYEGLSEWEREMVVMLIERDVRAGFSESTINKIWPGLVTDPPYMRCSLPKDAKLDKFDWKAGVYSQIKADGMFANIKRLHGGVAITSRNGTSFPVPNLGDSAAVIESPLGSIVLHAMEHMKPGQTAHGELLVLDVTGETLPRQIGNGALNSMLKDGELPNLHYILFDCWDLVDEDLPDQKYSERFKNAEALCKADTLSPFRLIEHRIVHSLPEAMEHYRSALARGLEGTVIKNPSMLWKDGTSKEQVKMKVEFEIELKVVGYEEGSGKAAGTLGALVCESECGQLKVNVGSGFTDAMRADIWSRKDLNVVTVKANGIMPPTSKPTHSLFLPIFVEERLDKKVADDLVRIKAQYDASVGG